MSNDRTIKCLVWDLDNTLWRGILLEGDQIVVEKQVRDTVSELDARGILQSIASRNDHKLAWDKLTSIGLSEYFLVPQIGGSSKSDSIRTIANALGIAIDACAFIDDDVSERAEVAYSLPNVMLIDAARVCELLVMPEMRTRFITSESKARRSMYKTDMERKKCETTFAGKKTEFLKTLQLRLTISQATDEDLRRAAELTARASQLNATGRIYSYEELVTLISCPERLLLIAGLEDRFGASGTVGLSLVEKRAQLWLIKLLITSCRVMSCGIGGIMLTHILKLAKSSGVNLQAEFISTNRNRIMYVTYRFHGFHEVRSQGNSILLGHDLSRIRPVPEWVDLRTIYPSFAPSGPLELE